MISSSSEGDTAKLREYPKASEYDPKRVIVPRNNRITAINSDVLKKNIVNEHEVVIEIYMITCSKTSKSYVGQTVSHVLNHGKYRRYGTKGRFNSHVSEAVKNNKSKQCRYLNNAIRKYGAETFSWRVLSTCGREEADDEECSAIANHQSLAPKGYNLKFGGKQFRHTDDSRTNVGNGVQRFFDDRRSKTFSDCSISPDIDPAKIIRPLRREGKQYGWYVLYSRPGKKRIKTDFGGATRDLDDSYQRAEAFVRSLQHKQ